MVEQLQVGLEQARATLPALVTRAHSGRATVITRHGRPVAAVVPLAAMASSRVSGGRLLALRGSGTGLWGADVGAAVAQMRAEWG